MYVHSGPQGANRLMGRQGSGGTWLVMLGLKSPLSRLRATNCVARFAGLIAMRGSKKVKDECNTGIKVQHLSAIIQFLVNRDKLKLCSIYTSTSLRSHLLAYHFQLIPSTHYINPENVTVRTHLQRDAKNAIRISKIFCINHAPNTCHKNKQIATAFRSRETQSPAISITISITFVMSMPPDRD